MAKAADLSKFQVNIEKPQTSQTPRTPRASANRAKPAGQGSGKSAAAEAKLISKGFRITQAAARQFDMLRAEIEIEDNGKNKGPALIAEALNLLFQKYGKPPIA